MTNSSCGLGVTGWAECDAKLLLDTVNVYGYTLDYGCSFGWLTEIYTYIPYTTDFSWLAGLDLSFLSTLPAFPSTPKPWEDYKADPNEIAEDHVDADYDAATQTIRIGTTVIFIASVFDQLSPGFSIDRTADNFHEYQLRYVVPADLRDHKDYVLKNLFDHPVPFSVLETDFIRQTGDVSRLNSPGPFGVDSVVHVREGMRLSMSPCLTISWRKVWWCLNMLRAMASMRLL